MADLAALLCKAVRSAGEIPGGGGDQIHGNRDLTEKAPLFHFRLKFFHAFSHVEHSLYLIFDNG